jgi:uncharacterized membrane protein YgcG
MPFSLVYSLWIAGYTWRYIAVIILTPILASVSLVIALLTRSVPQNPSTFLACFMTSLPVIKPSSSSLSPSSRSVPLSLEYISRILMSSSSTSSPSPSPSPSSSSSSSSSSDHSSSGSGSHINGLNSVCFLTVIYNILMNGSTNYKK